MYTIAPRRDSVPGGLASPECLLTCHVQVSAARDPDALLPPLCCLSHDDDVLVVDRHQVPRAACVLTYYIGHDPK